MVYADYIGERRLGREDVTIEVFSQCAPVPISDRKPAPIAIEFLQHSAP